MQLTSYIKSLCVLMMSMSLFACSINNTSKQPENHKASSANEDLQSISDDITDMVAIEVTPTPEENSVLNTNGKIRPIGTNKFAEQEKAKLSGIPIIVIDDYKKAIVYMQDKDWQSAEKIFDRIIIEQPQLSGSYVNRALISKERQQYPLAHEFIDKAISVNELNPYAHHLKGQLSKLDGDFSQAERSYLKALSIWPDYTEVQLSMAVLLELYRGRLLDSFNYYQSFLKLQPADTQVQRWFAGLKIKMKRAGITPPTISSSISEEQGD